MCDFVDKHRDEHGVERICRELRGRDIPAAQCAVERLWVAGMKYVRTFAGWVYPPFNLPNTNISTPGTRHRNYCRIRTKNVSIKPGA
ncbi:hypothetical protein GCM10023063_37150 [Arthrobacter methylotrophus]|uniref:Transposase n=1 Tax=Arthrobacter methylotrophus TaxID=121291 RepID=A0ABV5UKM2_9MICC